MIGVEWRKNIDIEMHKFLNKTILQYIHAAKVFVSHSKVTNRMRQRVVGMAGPCRDQDLLSKDINNASNDPGRRRNASVLALVYVSNWSIYNRLSSLPLSFSIIVFLCTELHDRSRTFMCSVFLKKFMMHQYMFDLRESFGI
jgi:hypothetical protein